MYSDGIVGGLCVGIKFNGALFVGGRKLGARDQFEGVG